MFFAAFEFNNILSWDVSRVLSMVGMFDSASSFNNDILSWRVYYNRTTAKAEELAKQFGSIHYLSRFLSVH